ncbi:glycosyltransferase family 2 protein [Duganella sp. sic0402]|uniref:glycosyltransferase family 2 protein n=1 Tax=Duganella sp. sic0402 TaxID=2854786 RepID=UPI001C48744E|nr:glycosyltransferase family 2 protein [Duganella sp. sic0402]
MKVYVVILNWNGCADTIECLESLQHTTGVEYVAVVCDNASSDRSMEKFAQWAGARFAPDEWQVLDRAAAEQAQPGNARLILIDTGANLGFAGGNNVGVRLALRDPACEFVWLLNNDTVVAPDAIAQAVARMQEDPRIGLCGSTLIYYHERDKVQAYGGAVYSPLRGSSRHVGAFSHPDAVPGAPQAVESTLSYVIGAAMLIRRSFMEQVGLMNEDYFLYFEEVDWATRGRGEFSMGYAPRSLVYHKEGASIGTSASGGSPLSMFYLYRNRIRFTKRFYLRYLVPVLGFCGWDVTKFVLRRRWPQARAAVKGVLQGLFSAA